MCQRNVGQRRAGKLVRTSKTSQCDTLVTGGWKKKKQPLQSLKVAEETVAQQTNEGAFKMYTQTSMIKGDI